MNNGFKSYLETLTPKKRDLACEAVREYLKGESEGVKILDTPLNVYQLCKDLSFEEEEHAVVLLMGQNYNLKKRIEIGKGGLTETCFDVRLILREALLNNATTITLVHNHPSGNNRPSKQDDELTRRVKNACDLMRIYLVDHVIIANSVYYSYRENGRI